MPLAELHQRVSSYSSAVSILILVSICTFPVIVLFFYKLQAAGKQPKQPKGCRRLGLKGDSNLSDEFDKKYAEGQPPRGEGWRLKSLWIYPVKSCRGIELDEGVVVATGMEHDRQFFFAQLKSTSQGVEGQKTGNRWEFVTQRQFSLLATVKIEVWVPDQSADSTGNAPRMSQSMSGRCEELEGKGVLIIRFPYQPAGWRGVLGNLSAAVRRKGLEEQFRVPFEPSLDQIQKGGYQYDDVTIWKDTVNALNMSPAVPPAFQAFLGCSNKIALFRIDNSKLRKVYRNAPSKEVLGRVCQVGGQDAYPLHLLNIASVRNLERLYSSPEEKDVSRLSATRFRANLIIAGPEAYDEDDYRLLRIGPFSYDVCCHTARCKMVLVDERGNRQPSEPDNTLRRERAIDPGTG